MNLLIDKQQIDFNTKDVKSHFFIKFRKIFIEFQNHFLFMLFYLCQFL